MFCTAIRALLILRWGLRVLLIWLGLLGQCSRFGGPLVSERGDRLFTLLAAH